jgi:hypothetical protein
MAGRILGTHFALGFYMNTILFCHCRSEFLNIFTVLKDLLTFLSFLKHESRAKFEVYGG